MTNTYLGHQIEVGPIDTGLVLSYTSPIVSARTEIGQDAELGAIGSLSVYTEKIHPETGNKIEGWHWDERVWFGEQTENYAISLPSTWDPTASGITETYFQSGIGSGRDLELQSIQLVMSSGLNIDKLFRLWAPEVNHGYYFEYDDRNYLYSDSSIINYPTYSGVLGEFPISLDPNTITLSDFPKVAVPIIAEQYQWDSGNGEYIVDTAFNRKIYFTGTRDSDGELKDTYNENTETITWANVDQTKDEFTVVLTGTLPQVIFNKQVVEEVGGGVVPSGLELLGYADGSANQQFHTLYSPVDSGMIPSIYSWTTTTGLITSWTPINFDEIIAGYQIKIDYDLGILGFGDPTDGTVAIPPAGDTVGIRYWKTVKLEYEPQNSINTVLATEANISPIYRSGENGFIYLSRKEEDPATIDLTAILPEIQTDVYGPVYIGNALATLVATVYDSNGQTLDNKSVTFTITSDNKAGSFGNSGDSITSITNEEGEAKAYYSSPSNINDIGEKVTATGWSREDFPITYPEYNQITTLHLNDLKLEGNSSNIYLYEIRIDDPILGYLDPLVTLTDTEAQLLSYYKSFFTSEDIYGPTGLDPTTGEPATNAISWEAAHRTIWNLVLPTLFTGNGGRKKIVAQFDAFALNPHTMQPGAVTPVQPAVIEESSGEYNLIYDTSAYAIDKPTVTDTVPSGTLYSYFVVAPTSIKVQASTYNSRLNQSILSNEITINLSIPPYADGLWEIDSINQDQIDEISSYLASVTASGQIVPLGFRLKSSNITLAAALDGVTFLDMNPIYTSYPSPSVAHQVRVV